MVTYFTLYTTAPSRLPCDRTLETKRASFKSCFTFSPITSCRESVVSVRKIYVGLVRFWEPWVQNGVKQFRLVRRCRGVLSMQAPKTNERVSFVQIDTKPVFYARTDTRRVILKRFENKTTFWPEIYNYVLVCRKPGCEGLIAEIKLKKNHFIHK